MPNVTIKLPHQTYRQARIWAAQNDLSLSKAFRLFLEHLPGMSAIKLRAPVPAGVAGAQPAAKLMASAATPRQKAR